MTLAIGLTGGIASGKTTTANIFKQSFNIDLIDADLVARSIVTPGSDNLEAIKEYFGTNIITTQGHLDRRQLREAIFSSPKKKMWLERLLHPAIKEKMKEHLSVVSSPYCLLVIPLLLESGWRDLCDRVLVIDVDENIQLLRTAYRDKIPMDQARKILLAQASRQQRINIADEVISNNKSYPILLNEIKKINEKYLEIASGDRWK